MVAKIIDNIQVQISNIHIRLESIVEPVENLSFGLTLDSLSVYTCDQNWKASFIDRTKSSTKNDTVYKKLSI